MALRIALITERFLPKIDGIVTRLLHTIRHLRQLGHTLLIIAPEGVREFEGTPVYGVTGFNFPLYRDQILAIPRPSVGRVLASFRPDLIHAVNPAMLGISAFYYSSTHRVPLVASYHTHLPKYLRYYGMGRLEGFMWWGIKAGYNRADLTLATSLSVQTDLQNRGVRRVELWRRGVDVELFHPQQASRIMRDRLTQGHPEDKLLLYVGRLSAEKEIEQCRDMLTSIPGVRLALVGDGPHRRKLERYFDSTPTYFAGYLKGADLAAAFASADVFFLPSRTETLGLVLLEAMAAGCPVVAAAAGGVVDVVQNGVTGHLYEPGNTIQAASAIHRLLSDSEHVEQIRRNGRREAEQWSWAAATLQLEQYYRNVIQRDQELPEKIAACRLSGASTEDICEMLSISRAAFRRHCRTLPETGRREG